MNKNKKMIKKELTNEQIGIKVAFNTVMVNLILTAFKFFAGIFGNSTAMIADAVHSLSDGLTTIFVMIGIKLANKKPDKEHPYGHERFECVAAIIMSVALFLTGVGIGWAGIQQILSDNYEEMPVPGIIALVAAVLTIVVKEAMYWYERAAAIKINSSALLADAWHSRSDSLSSIGSFFGILGARLGFPILDSIAAIIISVFILKVAIDIFRVSVGKMTDKSCDDETEGKMREVILAQEDVQGIDLLKTRMFADKIYVDVEICADGLITLHEAHSIAHTVHDAIETEFPKVKHCSVHVNPVDLPDDSE
ncbi:MAG: cation diffusion facilitator family transporter [Oscillospiraceae bacterium]|nr:cation diffusion facilitator family transporter [Oscillospiraceae bacterium]